MWLVRNLFNTSLGLKYLMALTGAGLFGFVLMHMLGNLTIFAGPAAINQYAAKLHSLGPILWVTRLGLLVIAAIHIWSAFKLSSENKKARKVCYEGTVKPVDTDRKNEIVSRYASRTMIYSGMIIAMFAFYHLAHYTWKVPQINGVEQINGNDVDFEEFFVYEEDAGEKQVAFVTPMPKGEGKEGENAVDVYRMVTTGFSVWWVSVFYVIAVGLLCVHLSHGLNAMFQSLGIKTRTTEKLISRFACTAAWLLFIGYTSVPLGILFGFVK
ncbi:MAG: succinate dehydrogenase cytochrome b subunit [Verrucomicrobiota bacterium]|jgi:succinate dehydrogenase / fumarate reductase cytochrome b subunit|nr:succinate dehydrogenase cytochrome b subunit [Verrucomicrobiota bacterium]MEE2941869.1 succinate dehydrogenase cytochrome b subunit [Verrucomicrobiota bacterium]